MQVNLTKWEEAQIRLQEEKMKDDREKIKSDFHSEILRLIPWIIFLLAFCYLVLGIKNISKTLQDLQTSVQALVYECSKSSWLQIVLNRLNIKI